MDNQEKNLKPGNLGSTKTRGELFRQGGLVLGILILLLGTGGFLKSLGAWQAGYYVSSQFASSMENILMYSVQLLDTDLIYDKETQEYILPKEVLTKSPGLQSQLKSELENLQEEIHALKQMDFEGYPEKEAKEQRFKVAKELEELEKQALNLEGEFLKKLEEEAKAELNAATEGLNQFQNAMILVDKPDNNITFVNKLYKGEDIESLNTVYYFSLDNKLNSHITYNKYLSPVVGGAKTAMADVGGDYNIIVAFENSPQFYEYHDNINYNYNTFKRDTLMGITTSGMIMICAGVVVLALYRRKGDAIIHTLGGEKSQKAIQNLLLLLSKIKFEFKLVAFLIVLSGIKAFPEQIFYNQISWRNITYWIILILVGILLLLDFAQTKNKEEYAKNSYLYNMRNKKTTRGPRGPMASVADGLQKHFDRIFIAGGLIILSFLLAISEGRMDIFVFSAIGGGIFILYQVYQMRTKLYDQRLVYLDQIAAATQEIVNGNMSVMVPEAENLPMGELAKNINKMKEGYGTAMEDQIKSERMKTELITNVSHDLKTPLTSIMNYVDLLKKEEILPEYARDYVTILDQKSQRLNALIQDLFEVSRAASGDMEIKRERLNVGELLNQTLAELNGKIQDSSLNFVVDIPMEPAFAMGDGNKLHRVFENLIVNIIKYSMDHSRVYIELIPGTKTKISMKNIANYPMNFSQEDVVQRFVRGDQSRSTEGSGLGLAITQSFVDLMDMKMKITTDGDLFKVEIEMDSVK